MGSDQRTLIRGMKRPDLFLERSLGRDMERLKREKARRWRDYLAGEYNRQKMRMV